MSPSDRTGRAHAARGKWTALILALVVNLLFIGVLVFSVSWQNRAPQTVTAELYAPPANQTTPRAPAPEPTPRPIPQPVPQPAPVPPPKPPAPVVEQPDPRAADIALKAQREVQRRQQELAAQKEQARKDAEAKKLAEVRDRQARQVDAMRVQAEREAQLRAQAERESQLRAQAERESQLRAQADREAQARALQAADAASRNKAQADWENRIRNKIRSNVTLPPDIAGNPEAVFDVVQLPTGEIIDVRLRKSSGVRAYDEAVQRAILKSSPLPRVDRPELFERSLTLRFRPDE